MRTSKLNPRQQRFVDEYLIDLNATQAAIRAGYSAKVANRDGPRLLSNAGVAEAVAERQAARAERCKIDADWVMNQWRELAEADPRELVQYVRTSCPECWDGQPREYPRPDCPKCGGVGKGHVVVSDTRKLSKAAAKLYAGVQVGRDGVKVNMRSQDGALENIARALGIYKDGLELRGGINITISQSDADL